MSLAIKHLEKIHQHPALTAVIQATQAEDGELYLVGGAIRDLLQTGELPKDLDIVTVNTSAKKLAHTVATTLNAKTITLDEQWGIYRVIVLENNLTLDISDALDNNIDKDLARRDLSINAIAVKLTDDTVLDPFNGVADLTQQTIRMTSEQNMLDDPLRLLRVFRFAAVIYNSTITPETLACVTQHKDKLMQAAPERIQYELFKLFNAHTCFPSLKQMADCGLLEIIIPELTDTRNIPSNGHHHLGLFDHTLELVRQCERVVEEFPEEARSLVRAPFNGVVSRIGLNKLACLLHDIGKPATQAIKEGTTDRLTFYGHDRVSEEMTDALAKRLRMGNETTDFVKKLVRWHLYPCQFSPTSSRKSVLKFFRRMGSETPDVILLALADRHSTLGPEMSGEKLEHDHQNHLWLLERYFEEISTLKLPPLLSGHDVMAILNIKPGPEIKEVLNALEEAQQLGEITTPEAARQWVSAQFGGVSSSRTTSP